MAGTKTRHFVFAVLLVVCIGATGYNATGNAQDLDSTSVNKAIAEIADKNHFIHVTYYLQYKGNVLANASTLQPDKRLLPMGSLSKSITAIAIALLIQDGKINLQSKVGELLQSTYAAHDRAMPASLQNVTVVQLLTHTAGLRSNKLHDVTDGVSTSDIAKNLPKNPGVFDFLAESGGDVSDGSYNYKYSNFSYLLLGLIVEAVSGEPYETFCQKNIFRPLEIYDAATLKGGDAMIEAYSGWTLQPKEIATVWTKVFDRDHPTLLTKETLNHTLLAPIGDFPPETSGGRYTLGAYVHRNSNNKYTLWHRGLKGTHFTYVEYAVPDMIWVATVSPVDQDNTAQLDSLPEIFRNLTQNTLQRFSSNPN